MKTSLRKLRGFALHKHGVNERRDPRPLSHLEEISQATQDMQDMRDCYDSLLSAAAATANSAFEFSESLREMGACLLEKTALNDDEESGRVLLMLGKAQFELQKLVNSYRSHIVQTITSPSESLLNELRTVEEMKRQCDEKRSVYEYMVARQREKGRSRSGKGEAISPEQLQAALDEYDEEATLFVFRLKSLKSGQSRSLLTQAARHHAAQLCFFRKALMSLETVEPHVKSITAQQHIDYLFTGLEDDDMNSNENNDDDDDASYDTQDDGELSFDYGPTENSTDAVSKLRNSMELDQVDITFPRVSIGEASKEYLDRSRNSFAFSMENRTISQSAPLFAEKKSDYADRLKQMQPSFSNRKLHTYVLPTPDDAKSSVSTGSSNPVPPMRQASFAGRPSNLWHSSPLEPKNYEKLLGDKKLSRPLHTPQSENNNNSTFSHLPPPLAEGLRFPPFDPHAVSTSKKIKRQAFSGPLSNKIPSTKPVLIEHPHLFSGPLLRNPLNQSSSSPKVSPSTSPPFVSAPKISELHELPRPPVSFTSNYPRTLDLLGHSAPLTSRSREQAVINKLGASAAASPLPLPPQIISRSFSIPSSSLRATTLHVSKPLDSPLSSPMIEEITSPPLTPISLSNDVQPTSRTHTVSGDHQYKGAD